MLDCEQVSLSLSPSRIEIETEECTVLPTGLHTSLESAIDKIFPADTLLIKVTEDKDDSDEEKDDFGEEKDDFGEDEGGDNGLDKSDKSLLRSYKQMRQANQSPWTLDNLGLGVHYFCMGVVQNAAIGALYGVLMGTMAVSGRMYTTSRIFVAGPWMLKVVFGFVTDCFPIAGFHRKHYGTIGWAIVAIAHIILASSFEEPSQPHYCIDTEFGNLGNFVPEAGICNATAAKDAWQLTCLTALSVMGLALAESAADGLAMECAQSYDLAAARGLVMLQSLAIRLVGGTIGSAFIAICFNSRKHLGFFEWELCLCTINLILAIVAVVAAVLWQTSTSCDMETMTSSHCNRCRYHQQAYTTLATKSLFNIAKPQCAIANAMIFKIFTTLYTPRFTKFALFQLLVPVLMWMNSPANDMIERYWANVQQLQEQMTGICVLVIFTIVIVCSRGHDVWTHWRIVITSSTCFGAMGAAIIPMITTDAIIRNQYFYQTHELFVHVPRACNYLIATIITTELSPVGLEASVYGIITGAHSIAPMIARAVSNPLYAYLPSILTDSELPVGALSKSELYVEDTEQFRVSANASIMLSSLFVILSLFLLPLLPKESYQLNKEPDTGNVNSNKIRCGFMTCSAILVIMLAFVATAMAVLPSTSCYPVVGGAGC